MLHNCDKVSDLVCFERVEYEVVMYGKPSSLPVAGVATHRQVTTDDRRVEAFHLDHTQTQRGRLQVNKPVNKYNSIHVVMTSTKNGGIDQNSIRIP